ncbi:hypothetical protein [Arthrobacter sp. UNC362MFTsu5.1]|uniref:hypothetical protein n=1 Tax=Arthrobacter sp. UNC362MFTsu5.1 TaxID=1449044 RepID=UPI0004828D88|nr:hypothetical protein [Arthrobacter sp. UNC362MFTsu5.1]
MNPLKFLAALPQPVKTFYILFFIVFVVTFVSVPLGAREVTRWASGALGLVAILLGLSMLTNLNGSATAMSKYMKESKPMGVDYSGSFLASPAYARFFGGFFAFVGGMFVFTSLNSSEMWGS